MNTAIKKPQPLSVRHAKWVIGWALEACALAIIKCEADLLRHQGMLERADSFPGVSTHAGLGSAFDIDRNKKIVELKMALREYHEVYRFLQGSKQMVDTKGADEFAEQMKEYFNQKK